MKDILDKIRSNVRAMGALKLALGIIVAIAVWLVMDFIYKKSLASDLGTQITLAGPVAFILMGLLELVSGIPFLKISSKWDSLSGLQRGILGTTIAFIAIFVFLIISAVLR